MHFSLQNKPKNIFKNPWTIVILLVLLLVVCVIAYTYGGIGAVYAILLIVVSITIAVSIKSHGKKGFPEFDTSDQGIIVNGNTYPWPSMKYYSWYGDKQGERVGLVGITKTLDYDPINPYKYAKTQILELHMGIGKNLKLQIDSTQTDNLTAILKQYGVKHISLLRKLVGL
jgi:hypothetical protein